MAHASPPASARSSTEVSSPSKALNLASNGKPKKPPPITPRRFTKFFTPRPTSNNASRVKTSRRALQDITRPALNRKRPIDEPPLFGNALPTIRKTGDEHPIKNNKRKLSFSSVTFSPRSSPIRRSGLTPLSSQGEIPQVDGEFLSSSVYEDSDEETGGNYSWNNHEPIRNTRKLIRGPFSLLTSRLGGDRRRGPCRQAADWQDETARFFSGPGDWHRCHSNNGQHLVLPFCITACNTNSLVAMGDEEGGVRLLDSSSRDQTGMSRAYLNMQPHDNAIMDLEFSADDRLLATSSGDQTTRIIDMSTQQEIHRLACHSSSVKRAQFQPSSNGNVVATCSRDGSILLWDLRCSGGDICEVDLPPTTSLDGRLPWTRHGATWLNYKNRIGAAHVSKNVPVRRESPMSRKYCEESTPRRDDVSVTTIAFLPSGRDHLLVSASEADACVKLWDIRTTYFSRSQRPLPVATAQAPASHKAHRQFGMTSMSFNSDFSRLYTVCRDHTVYAYSTSHLVLGHAPEFKPSSFRRMNGSNLSGLGPLYGFRHPRLQVGSFYVKTSVRKAASSNTELLAVGSSDNATILFPTSEAYLESLPRSCSSNHAPLRSSRITRLRHAEPSLSSQKPGADTPIYEFGSALVEGHSKEVTGVSWTSSGELVTVSDDFHARCWRERADREIGGGGTEARALRLSGGKGGRRWMSGWADVGERWDVDEEGV